jgi:hypothetical protein
MAVISRSGKFKRNEQGDAEVEEKTKRYKGTTTVEGRLKLYEKLGGGGGAKGGWGAGNLGGKMAKELEKAGGGRGRVLNPHRLAVWTLPRLVDRVKRLGLS